MNGIRKIGLVTLASLLGYSCNDSDNKSVKEQSLPRQAVSILEQPNQQKKTPDSAQIGTIETSQQDEASEAMNVIKDSFYLGQWLAEKNRGNIMRHLTKDEIEGLKKEHDELAKRAMQTKNVVKDDVAVLARYNSSIERLTHGMSKEFEVIIKPEEETKKMYNDAIEYLKQGRVNLEASIEKTKERLAVKKGIEDKVEGIQEDPKDYRGRLNKLRKESEEMLKAYSKKNIEDKKVGDIVDLEIKTFYEINPNGSFSYQPGTSTWIHYKRSIEEISKSDLPKEKKDLRLRSEYEGLINSLKEIPDLDQNRLKSIKQLAEYFRLE